MKGVDPNLDFFVRAPKVLPFWIIKDLEVNISTLVGTFETAHRISQDFRYTCKYPSKAVVTK